MTNKTDTAGQPVATFVFLVVVVLTSTASLPLRAQSIDVIAPTGLWVTDNGDMLSTSEERLLSERLARFASESSVQIVVVTLPDLHGAAPGDYATELGRRWKVGAEGLDNGFVVLVSRDDRQVFIATGYGAEAAVPDAVAGRIVRNVIVPNFREGRFYDGLSGAVDRLVQAAAGEYPGQSVSASRPSKTRVLLIVLVVLAVVVLLIAIISAARHHTHDDDDRGSGRRRRRSSGLPPVIIWGGGGGHRRRSSGRSSGPFGGSSGGFGGGGFGGFSGGGGSFGGGGAGGGW